MIRKPLLLAGVALLMVLTSTTASYADISNAAVLFLRIAPGARAAGMGEAYVAIADDATATHWNPAGLGAHPLSNEWKDLVFPNRLRPVTAMAAISEDGGSNYMDFEIWALTAKGIARSDHRDWYEWEEFTTRTDQTVEQIVRSFFRVDNPDLLAEITQRVAAANNEKSLAFVESFRDSVLAHTPPDYEDTASLHMGLDSMVTLWSECRLDWRRLDDVVNRFRDAMKDSVLTNNDLESINFGVERSRMRFIPEELRLPYSALFRGEVVAIASNDRHLLVGTSDGLGIFNGRSWRVAGREDGLPSTNILCLTQIGNMVFVGTDSGMVYYNGLALRPLLGDSVKFKGTVTAIGGQSAEDVYAVINDDLYHFDGFNWSNSVSYQVEVDDTPEKLADKMSLYGTAAEKEAYLEKLMAVLDQSTLGGGSTMDEAPAESEAMPSLIDEMEGSEVDSTEAADSSAADAAEEMAEPDDADTSGAGMETAATGSTEFAPGTTIHVPFTAGIKGDVYVIHMGSDGRLFLGTDHGVLEYYNNNWQLTGFKTIEVGENQTVDSIVAATYSSRVFETPEAYRDMLVRINDLGDGPLEPGKEIKVYANRTAAPVHAISEAGGVTFFGTDAGLLQRERGDRWSVGDIRGMSDTPVIGMHTAGEGIWFASTEKVTTVANGQFEITMMHVKWLPELADDLYYDFFSAVLPVEGWGTIGGNVTFISYGKFTRTLESGPNPVGTFESYDLAVTLSYGTSLRPNLAGGLSFKFIRSQLADVGAGDEKGSGSSTGFAIDFGLLYRMSSRLDLGLAVTNIGPKMKYIDAAQADDLPRNLAFGFAYKIVQSPYVSFLVTAEANKLLVGLDDGFSEELKQTIFNGGAELKYADLIAARAGYIFDEEGDVKTPTLGIGLKLLSSFHFDFGYIPNSDDVALANTLRISVSYKN